MHTHLHTKHPHSVIYIYRALSEMCMNTRSPPIANRMTFHIFFTYSLVMVKLFVNSHEYFGSNCRIVVYVWAIYRTHFIIIITKQCCGALRTNILGGWTVNMIYIHNITSGHTVQILRNIFQKLLKIFSNLFDAELLCMFIVLSNGWQQITGMSY